MFESFMWGGSVIQPLFFSFPEDEETYKRDISDRTFMWGKTLYVIPSIIEGSTHVRAYLPNWRWYDLKSFDMVEIKLRKAWRICDCFDQPLGLLLSLLEEDPLFLINKQQYQLK